MTPSKALQDLKTSLPHLALSEEPDDLLQYGRDWTKHFQPQPLAVAFPRSTADVKAIVLWARQNKIGLVPSGGRTGLSGGAVANRGELVVNFEKMNRILSFDPYDQAVTCQPGVITEQLQVFAQEKGLYFPVDFASRGSSQIGGNISTNAGGIKVLRYGLFRQWVSGLEVVTGSGEVLKLNQGLIKNATGYDLRQLFIGAEGTLGFITEATLQLTRPPQELMVFLFAVPHLDAVMKIFHAFKSQTSLVAFEMFTDVCLEIVLKHTQLPRPLSENSPFYLVVEVEKDSGKAHDKALEVFSSGMEQGWITDGVEAQTPEQARDFWRLREDISEATAPASPYKNDISVRVSQVPEFLEAVNATLKKEYPHFQVAWFGHIGDGNLHINILKPKELNAQDFLRDCHRVDQTLFQIIQKQGGSISAEHGVGLTKKPYLEFTRSKEEIGLMKAVKSIFDPDHIMNPGKIFDL